MSPIKKEAFVPPYISIGDFEKFISLPRKYDPLSVKDLQTAGFTLSNSYTLIGSLRAMKIYDDKGKLLERPDLINLGAKDEKVRRDTYKKIVLRTYDELLKDIPHETATLGNVQHNFQLRGAANSISIKAARLFLWLANQAGLKTKEEAKPEKTASNSHVNQKVDKPVKKDTIPDVQKDDATSNKQRLLDVILASIAAYEGLPPLDLVKEARELSEQIDLEKKNKNRHADTPEPSLKGV